MSLEKLRSEINRVDKDIIRLIAKRQELAGKIAKIKIGKGIPIHDQERTDQILAAVFDMSVECKIDPVGVQKVFEPLIAMSEERQRECSGEGNLP